VSKRDFIGGGRGIVIEDVGGSFRRFFTNAPKRARQLLTPAVLVTANKLAQRMEHGAPEGPDAPHIKRSVTFKHRGLGAQVGYIAEDFGADQAADGSDATIAEVALFNEYRPNNQPFMRPAAEAESSDFVKRISDVLSRIGSSL
jgi:hypothetical protein